MRLQHRWPARLVAPILAAVALGAWSGVASASQDGSCLRAQTTGHWTTINPPDPSTQLSNLRADGAGDLIANQNNHSVIVSTDGGCTWKTTLDLDQLEGVSPPYGSNFVDHVIASSQPGSRYVYVFFSDYSREGQECASGNSIEHPEGVAVSKDGGATWKATDLLGDLSAKAPTCSGGNLPAYAVSPDGTTAYVLTELSSWVVYTTHDGGATWHTVTATGMPASVFRTSNQQLASGLIVDPVDPNRMWWAYDGSGPNGSGWIDTVLSSSNGGAAWKPVLQAKSSTFLPLDPFGLMGAGQSQRTFSVAFWTPGAVYVSPGGGAWKKIKTASMISGSIESGVGLADGTFVVQTGTGGTGCSASPPPFVYHSDPTGKHWTPLQPVTTTPKDYNQYWGGPWTALATDPSVSEGFLVAAYGNKAKPACPGGFDESSFDGNQHHYALHYH